ncbi:MAG: hypothetical protein ACYDA2_08625 [Acidimicrobiales bacterium]
MHPIERLRYVARAGWAGPAALGAEAAYALADLSVHEPAAVLPACRRLLERNPSCGPLWWVAARVLSAGDLLAEAERCAEELDDDPTDDVLEEALQERRVVRHGGVAEVATADVVLVDTDAMGPGGMVVDGDAQGLLEAARVTEAEVWVAAGVGRVLPPRLWDALCERLDHRGGNEVRVASYLDVGPGRVRPLVASLAGVARVVGPSGVLVVGEALHRHDCPEPPELLSRW